MSGKVSKFAAVFEARKRMDEEAQAETRPDPAPGPESAPGTIWTPPPVQNVPGPDPARGPESGRAPASRPTEGWLKLPNHFIYDLMPTLKPSDAVVLMYLIAQTHGFQRTRCATSLAAIGTSCHLSRSQARVSLRALQAKGHLTAKYDPEGGEGQGYRIEMLLPRPDSGPRAESKPRTESGPRAKYVPIKERTYERNIKEAAPDEVEEYLKNREALEGKTK